VDLDADSLLLQTAQRILHPARRVVTRFRAFDGPNRLTKLFEVEGAIISDHALILRPLLNGSPGPF
jgi:hypothetical protein